MKKILVFTLLLTLIWSCKEESKQTEINWMTFEEAVAAQKENPKKIMIDAYTNWCGPCKMLDKQTFNNPDLVAYVNENYYAVKFNAEGNETIKFKGKTYENPNYDPAKAEKRNAQHQLAGFFRVEAYPTILFLDEKAEVLTPLKGFHSPEQLEIYLNLFATNAYKTIQTPEEWAKYLEGFKNVFKVETEEVPHN